MAQQDTTVKNQETILIVKNSGERMVLDEVMLNVYRKKRGSRCSVQKNYIEIQGSKCQKKKKKA